LTRSVPYWIARSMEIIRENTIRESTSSDLAAASGKGHSTLDRRFLTVVALLLLHFFTRYEVGQNIPLNTRGDGMFSADYQVAVNLVAGRGFYEVALPDAPEAVPIREFELLQRPEITPSELQAYLNQPWSRPVDLDHVDKTADARLSTARTLELRLAAHLWKWFGIRWSVIFTFYELVSTGAAFLIFLIGRKAAGFWCGLVAMILYTLSPLESVWVVRSLRDINPLWFAILGCAAVYCLAGSFRNRWLNLASYVVAGAVALVGYGWRLDSLLLPPVLLVLLIAKDLIERSNWRVTATHAALFGLGVLSCYGFILSLRPPGSLNPGLAYHIAFYGNAERTNLAGLENSLKIYRCDLDTILAARYYATAMDIPGHGEPFASPAYAAACRAMYFRSIRFDAWHWIAGFPSFLFHAMRGTTLRDLPMDRDWLPPVPPPVQFLMSFASLLLPVTSLLGIAAVFFWGKISPITTGLAALLVIYAAILFVVLPEHQHAGILVLPICVLGGFGITSLLGNSSRQSHWGIGLITLFALAGVWGIACVGGYFWSLYERDSQIAEIRRVASTAVADPSIQLKDQTMSVLSGPDSTLDRAGYLLEIETGPNPGPLDCKHVRSIRVGTKQDGRVYESEHRLFPNRRQFFFFSAYQGRLVGPYQYKSIVDVHGDARILSARRADLSNWHNLEVSTVFYDGERSPGSPIVGHPSEITIYALPASYEP
jgi:hypothetical protein